MEDPLDEVDTLDEEPDSEKQLREWTRETLLGIELIPEYSQEVIFQSLLGHTEVREEVKLPPVTLPQFKLIGDKIYAIQKGITGTVYQKYGFIPEVHEPEDQESENKVFREIDRELMFSPEIVAIFEEVFKYFSKINDVLDVDRLYLTNEALPKDYSEDRFGYFRSDTHEYDTIGLNVEAILTEPGHYGQVWLEIALHEWLHHWFWSKKQLDAFIDKSEVPEDNEFHSEQFKKFEKALKVSWEDIDEAMILLNQKEIDESTTPSK